MKTIRVLLFALLAQGTAYGGLAWRSDVKTHKPCLDLTASPASEGDTAAFARILGAAHVDMEILLYVSRDPVVKNHGGAMSFRCQIDNHEIYETYENWTIYDPDLIQGDAARDFVFAHEIAHHLSGDTTSDQPLGKDVELRADYNGAKYLLAEGWNEARLLYALDLLNLSQDPQRGYPTLEERKANLKDAAKPPGPLPPSMVTGWAVVPGPDLPGFGGLWVKLLGYNYMQSIRFLSVRTNKYVCARGVPDPNIPSAQHFTFFDNCDKQSRTRFTLQPRPNGELGYWLLQSEEPCPEFAQTCVYALESVGGQLQFWNQNLAADHEWEQELGEQELFSVEADAPMGLVRIKLHNGGYIFADPTTGKLQSGGNQEQAAKFKVEFETNQSP